MGTAPSAPLPTVWMRFFESITYVGNRVHGAD